MATVTANSCYNPTDADRVDDLIGNVWRINAKPVFDEELKKHYKKIFNEYYKTGTIISNKSSSFF